MDAKAVGKVRRAAEQRLKDRLQAVAGVPLDRAGRTPDAAQAVVVSIPPPALEAAFQDVRTGDGGELRKPTDPSLHPRFHSSRSSCALAVNAFGPWRLDPSTLSVGGLSGFTSVRFERKLPISGVTGRAPNLDLVADGPVVLGVESKLLEHLSSAKPAEFRDAHEGAVERLAHPTWQDAYRRLKHDPGQFEYFGAAQIVKHYLGLKSNFAGRTARLLYLFWEPQDRESFDLFEQHRGEARRFASSVADPEVSFAWMTYPDLWREWEGLSPEAVPADHLRLLRARYAVTLGADG